MGGWGLSWDVGGMVGASIHSPSLSEDAGSAGTCAGCGPRAGELLVLGWGVGGAGIGMTVGGGGLVMTNASSMGGSATVVAGSGSGISGTAVSSRGGRRTVKTLSAASEAVAEGAASADVGDDGEAQGRGGVRTISSCGWPGSLMRYPAP